MRDPPEGEPAFISGEEPADFDGARPGRARRRRASGGAGSVLPWVLLVILAVAAAAFGVLVLIPMRDELHVTQDALAEANSNVGILQRQAAALSAAKGQLEDARADLAQELESKQRDLAALQAAEEDLAQKLKQQVEAGNISIRRDRGELVVDLVDRILFDSGEAALNGAGKKLLAQVAASLLKVPDKVIEVRGHTDAVPIAPKLHNRFPSNWELSAQRATNVVRVLQDECHIPGPRLVAEAFGEYRPASNNASKLGRARNRRIELVLVPQDPHRDAP